MFLIEIGLYLRHVFDKSHAYRAVKWILHSGSRSFDALIKNCRIQLPKPETVRISCGPRAQPALAFIVETERAFVLGRAEGKLRSGLPATRNEKRRKEKSVYIRNIYDGDMPKVAATDFNGDNNAKEKERIEKRQELVQNSYDI